MRTRGEEAMWGKHTLATTAPVDTPGKARSRQTCCSCETGPDRQSPTTPMRKLRTQSQLTSAAPRPTRSKCCDTVSLPAILQPTTAQFRAAT